MAFELKSKAFRRRSDRSQKISAPFRAVLIPSRPLMALWSLPTGWPMKTVSKSLATICPLLHRCPLTSSSSLLTSEPPASYKSQFKMPQNDQFYPNFFFPKWICTDSLLFSKIQLIKTILLSSSFCANGQWLSQRRQSLKQWACATAVPCPFFVFELHKLSIDIWFCSKILFSLLLLLLFWVSERRKISWLEKRQLCTHARCALNKSLAAGRASEWI